MDNITLVIEKQDDDEQDDDGTYYLVSCPEIQGFVTDGNTIPEALAMAIDCYVALEEHENPEIKQWSLELAELLRAMRGDETYTKRLERLLE